MDKSHRVQRPISTQWGCPRYVRQHGRNNTSESGGWDGTLGLYPQSMSEQEGGLSGHPSHHHSQGRADDGGRGGLAATLLVLQAVRSPGKVLSTEDTRQ